MLLARVKTVQHTELEGATHTRTLVLHQKTYLLIKRQIWDFEWWTVVENKPLELQEVEQRLEEKSTHVSKKMHFLVSESAVILIIEEFKYSHKFDNEGKSYSAAKMQHFKHLASQTANSSLKSFPL